MHEIETLFVFRPGELPGLRRYVRGETETWLVALMNAPIDPDGRMREDALPYGVAMLVRFSGEWVRMTMSPASKRYVGEHLLALGAKIDEWWAMHIQVGRSG